MKKPIVLLTNTCPFQGEAFLKNELAYILEDQPVYLFPILAGKTMPLTDWDKPHIRVCTEGPGPVDKLLALGHGLAAPSRNGELKAIFSKPSPLRNLLKAVKFAALSDSRARAVRRFLKKEGITAPVIYSYWFYESAYAAARLRKTFPGSRVICRCHGYDLYEVRHPGGYLPFRSWLMEQTDTLCPISQDGVDYLKTRFPQADNLRLSRLGTGDRGLCIAEKAPVTTVVSCSNLLDVKRVDLLIKALAQCPQPVRWLHFGDGPLMESLCRQAEGLPPHIQWQFMGSVPNAELMTFYKENYVDVFVNVSSSEGVPVSIMEALSFGIPAVATDVGGTHEIVEDGCNGILLPADTRPEAIAEAIFRAKNLPDARENARRIWQERCDATENYADFYENILKTRG